MAIVPRRPCFRGHVRPYRRSPPGPTRHPRPSGWSAHAVERVGILHGAGKRETPLVGFNSTSPQKAAGFPTDPPVSVPSATSTMSAAAALPPEGSPAIQFSSWGSRTSPRNDCPRPPPANSSRGRLSPDTARVVESYYSRTSVIYSGPNSTPRETTRPTAVRGSVSCCRFPRCHV